MRALFLHAAIHVHRVVPHAWGKIRQHRLPPVVLKRREIDRHDGVGTERVQDVPEHLSYGQAVLWPVAGPDRLTVRNVTEMVVYPVDPVFKIGLGSSESHAVPSIYSSGRTELD